MLIGLDPGEEKSAIVVFDGVHVHQAEILRNRLLLSYLRRSPVNVLAYEMVACYGMPVGKEIFETVFWLGRFVEAYTNQIQRQAADAVFRKDVKLHLCNSLRAKDSNVRQALIDRFGGSRQRAIGTKKSPGPLYGVTSHCWSALAVAVYWWDMRQLSSVPAYERPK